MTEAFVIFMLVVTVMYDAIAWAVWGPDATITSVTLRWSKEYPIIPFTAGLLMGHLFW